MRDRMPHVVSVEGTDWWVLDGLRVGSVSGRRRDSPGGNHIVTLSTFDDVMEEVWSPANFVRANVLDGVFGSVLRPTQGLVLYGTSSDEVFNEICAAYNRWAAEFVWSYPMNLKAMAMLPKEPRKQVPALEQAMQKGFVGAVLSVNPGPDRPYSSSEYERLWGFAEESGAVLSLHVLSNYDGPYGRQFLEITASDRVNADYWIRQSLSQMVLAGVLERHPHLRLESSEHEGSWLPSFLWQLDWVTKNRTDRSRWARSPVEQLTDQLWLGITHDRLAVLHRDEIGVDRITWGSDFPHSQSTYPNSIAAVDLLLDGVSARDRDLIVGENSRGLFGFAEDDRLLAAARRSQRPDPDRGDEGNVQRFGRGTHGS